MKNIIPDETLQKLAKASIESSFRTYVALTVARHFRSVHYLSSNLICDCVVLNVLLNTDVTPTSADEIITSIRRHNKSLYTTVDNAFFPISDKFEEYAKNILGNEYEKVKSLGMRKTNYIVYVLSLDVKRNTLLDPNEINYLAYGDKAFGEIDYPHY